MSVTLRNGLFRASVSQMGAELTSLADLATGQEYMWQADPAWWAGTAPVLFPVIGGLKGGAYTFEGKQYRLPSHGFARNSAFRVSATGADFAALVLSSSSETRESYPFDFSLAVGFRLMSSGVSVRYEVRNTGSGRMYFSIGSHPAFNLPFAGGALENYYVVFEREEALERWFFKDGMVTAGKAAEVMENSRVLSLSRTLFDQGPVIFKGPQSRRFIIANSRNTRSITVATDGVPFVAVWSKPNAPFLCIEPWNGLPDMSDCSGNIVEKEGIIALEPGSCFGTGYSIEVA